MKEGDVSTHGRRAVIDLRRKILSGELPGGMRLFEVPLAETMQISRTPVREALSRLAEEGLLDRLPNGGFAVRRFGYADIVDSIELRGVMEGVAARLAAERGAVPERMARFRQLVAELDTCFGAAAQDVDFDRYADLNGSYHQELAGLAGSDIIRREVERASALPFASPSAFMPDRADLGSFHLSLRTAQAQHKAILDAIAAREGTQAEALARAHARSARRNLEYIFAEKPGLISQVPGLGLIHP